MEDTNYHIKTIMEVDEYIKNRVDDQIAWYDKKIETIANMV